MSRKMYFDVRDVPSCARLGLSGRKMWIWFKALVLSWAAWSAFTYLGWLAADPAGLGAVWGSSRLLPLPAGIFWTSWQSVALLAGGILVMTAVMLSAALRASRITFEQIRGDDFFSGREAAEFARRHGRPLYATPAALVAGLALAVLCGLLLGLAGRIPAVGPVLLGILAVPAWSAALLVVLGSIALLAAFPLVPAIVACTKGDTFETMFELFSSVTSQPWRLALYALASFITRVLALAVFLAAGSLALGILVHTTALAGAPSPYALLQGGLRYVAPSLVGAYAGLIDILGVSGQPGATVQPLAGALLAASGAAIVLVAASYWFSSCSSAWTVIYLAVRRRKDGEDLLRRADQEDLAEFEKQYGSADESTRAGQTGCAGDAGPGAATEADEQA